MKQKYFKMAYELQTQHDSRKSFYGKARVEIINGKSVLYSYNTKVAQIENGKPIVYGTYSQTTLRHIKEFLLQNGFKAENSKQIMKDYGEQEKNISPSRQEIAFEMRGFIKKSTTKDNKHMAVEKKDIFKQIKGNEEDKEAILTRLEEDGEIFQRKKGEYQWIE